MELSIAYIQPLIEWLRTHPEWASIIVFFISFLESLAIVGSIVPGSIMMTMVGILAGTGVIGLKSCLSAAIIGAIAGDGGSYFLGYYFSDRLALLWPFSRYPNWLAYGKNYFEHHGGKSVFLGRFVGPLRSIIPVIAGMMKMGHLHFFVANTFSAIGWSLLYLGPGILVGAASSSLSTQTATKLFLVIIAILLFLWLFGLGVKKIWARTGNLLRPFLHSIWESMHHIQFLKTIAKILTPRNETHYAKTFTTLLLCVFFVTSSIFLTQDMAHRIICNHLDLPIYFFLQSIRTHSFDVFFTTVLLFLNPLAILTLVITQVCHGVLNHSPRFSGYWISLLFFTTLLCLGASPFLFHHAIGFLAASDKSFFSPVECFFLSTSIFAFFSLTTLSNPEYPPALQQTFKWLITAFIFFASISLIYLGETWFSTVLTAFMLGCSISLLHWLFYRRIETLVSLKSFFTGLVFYIVIGALMATLNFHQTLKIYNPRPTQYMLTHDAWWNQKKSLLPIYSSNRLGQPAGLFNLQYAGAIDVFEHSLISNGWEKQSTSFIENLIARTNPTPSKIPLTGQFYLNRKPDLVMSYGRKGAKPILLLHLWRSNFHLLYEYNPIWIGNIQLYHAKKHTKHTKAFMAAPFYPLLHGLRDYKIRTLDITNVQIPIFGQSVKILLIEK